MSRGRKNSARYHSFPHSSVRDCQSKKRRNRTCRRWIVDQTMHIYIYLFFFFFLDDIFALEILFGPPLTSFWLYVIFSVFFFRHVKTISRRVSNNRPYRYFSFLSFFCFFSFLNEDSNSKREISRFFSDARVWFLRWSNLSFHLWSGLVERNPIEKVRTVQEFYKRSGKRGNRGRDWWGITKRYL